MADGPTPDTEAGRIAALPAVEVLRLFRTRALAPSEYLGVVLDRIAADARHELPLNAFMEVLDGPAREEARAADAFYARDGNDAPLGAALLGLPVATKEKHALAGRSISQGMRAHADAVAAEDHPAVARIRAAGGIVHGRTTSPEFSCATVTHSRMWGVTRNPWDRALSPGGSSGGAAAALAAGMTPLATASDIAGSTRLPAAFTGNVGYKGPYGTVPGAGPLAADWYRGDGAMARTVADTALLTDVMRGPHPSDHATVPSRGIAVATEEQALSTLQGRRLAYSPTLGDFPVERGVRREVDRTVAALEAAGADVVEVDLPWTTEEIGRVSMAHFGHLLAEGMRSLLAGREDTAEAYTLRFIEVAREHAARHTLFETVAAEHRIQADLAAALRGVDALLTPASAVRALAADGQYLDGITVTDQPDGVDRTLEHYWQAHMTVPFNIANRCPALCVPSGTAAGFPVGLQIVGHPFDETTVFEIGRAVEGLPSTSGQ
ncbi:amidase [Nocardiopsis sp. HNM0947]|uniref:Amidase n=1 Tax=Nocardiopsis coralli TaxID=2772213 RepID=A0ABR9P3G7_9ACTN|nr:amidase [Nocardiopsis coralli]MBE2998382.1 amidase [Nocardiopsis coralli]